MHALASGQSRRHPLDIVRFGMGARGDDQPVVGQHLHRLHPEGHAEIARLVVVLVVTVDTAICRAEGGSVARSLLATIVPAVPPPRMTILLIEAPWVRVVVPRIYPPGYRNYKG